MSDLGWAGRGLRFYFEHAPCPSAAHIREVEFAGGRWDDLERAGGARSGHIGVDVRSRRQVISREHHLLIAQFDVAEVPPTPATLLIISERVRSGHSSIGDDGRVDGFEPGRQRIVHYDVV